MRICCHCVHKHPHLTSFERGGEQGYIHAPIRLAVYIYLFIYLSVFLYLSVSVCLSTCVSTYLYLPVYLCLCSSFSLSIYLYQFIREVFHVVDLYST